MPAPAKTPPPTASPKAPADPYLSKLESGFQTRYQSDAQKPFEAAVAALNKSYLASGVARARADAQSRGSLKEVMAFDEVKARIERGEGVPAQDEADAPESLKALRTIYRTELAKLEAKRDQTTGGLYDIYDKALEAYVKELTQTGKVQEALKVADLRKEIASKRGALAVTAPAVPGAPALTNSLGMKFVPVPGTEIFMCIHETRRQDYVAYANEVPGVDGSWKNQQKDGIPCGDKDDHPVVGLSWEDAVKFCEWLSKKEGKTYRLPTDEEWSIAVGLGGKEKHGQGITPQMLSGKETTEFPWDGDYPPTTKDKAGNYADESWHKKFPTQPFIEDFTDGFPTTAPVMSFKPNKLGLYDMGGNVWEYVEDWWNAAKAERVLRGASFGGHGDRLLSSLRPHRTPGSLDYDRGFRLVVEKGPSASASAASQPASPPASSPPPPAASAQASEDGFTNSLGMKFVPVPGTEILMCIHETRRKDYAAFAAEVPGLDASWKPLVKDFPVEDEGSHPVVRVNYKDAMAFCDWLGKKDGRTYRIPTDREWSFAVGIGEQEQEGPAPMQLSRNVHTHPWGDKWPPPRNSGNFADDKFNKAFNFKAIGGYSDGFATTAPVMSFKPNALGIFDMGGNVREQCSDRFTPDGTDRCHRDVAWSTNSGPFWWISSCRGHTTGNGRWDDLGFRIVAEKRKAVIAPVAPSAAAPVSSPPADLHRSTRSHQQSGHEVRSGRWHGGALLRPRSALQGLCR